MADERTRPMATAEWTTNSFHNGTYIEVDVSKILILSHSWTLLGLFSARYHYVSVTHFQPIYRSLITAFKEFPPLLHEQ